MSYNIEQMANWCLQARDLLHAKSRNPLSSLTKYLPGGLGGAIDNLQTDLARLADDGEFAKEYRDHAEQFRQISERARRADRTTGSKDLEAIGTQIEQLQKSVEATVGVAKAMASALQARDRLVRKVDIEKTQPGALTGRLDTLLAALNASPEHRKDAIEAFKKQVEGDHRKTLDDCIKGRETAQKQEAEQVKALPDCQALLQRRQAELERIAQDALGAPGPIASARQQLAGAAQLMAQGRCLDAKKQLEQLDLKQTAAAVDKARQALQGGPNQQLVQRGRGALDRLAQLVTADVLAARRQALDQQLDWLNGGPMNRVPAVTAFVVALETEAGKLETDRSGVTGALDTLTKAVGQSESGQSAPAYELQVFRDRIAGVRALLQQQDVAAATQRVAALQSDWGAFDQRWRKARSHWESSAGKLDGWKKLVGDAAGGQGVPQSVQAEAVQLGARLAAAARLAQEREWLRLDQLASDLEAAVTSFGERAKAFGSDAAAKARQQAEQAFAQARQGADQAIADLARACQQAGVDPAAAGADGPQAAATLLRQLLEQWQQLIANKTDGAPVDLAPWVAQLGQIEARAHAAAQPKALQALQAAREDESARQEFLVQEDKCRALIAALAAVSASDAARFGDELDRIKADSARRWSERLAALTAGKPDLAGRIREAASSSRGALPGQIQRCKQQCTQLTQRIEELRKRLKDAKLTDFKALLDKYAGQVADVLALADTGNWDACQSNLAQLGAVSKGLAELDRQLSANPQALAGVAENAERIAKLFDERKDELSKYTPRQYKALQGAVSGLAAAVSAMEVAKGEAECKRVEGLLEDATAAAQGVKADIGGAKVLSSLAQAALKTFSESKVAPDYATALADRLKQASAAGETPDKVTTATVQLRLLLQEINAANSDRKTALAKQTALLADRQRSEQARRRYEAERKSFEQNALPRAEKALKTPGADPGQLGEIKRMLDDAAAAAKQGNHDQALKLVQQATRRVGEVEADPGGSGIGARNALPAQAELYRKAVDALVVALGSGSDGLPAAAEAHLVAAKVPDAHREKILAKLRDACTRVRERLPRDAFDDVVARLSAKPASGDGRAAAEQQLRGVREQGLQKVRLLRAQLVSHPVAQGLFNNPLQPRLGELGRALATRLDSLEANFRRAVR